MSPQKSPRPPTDLSFPTVQNDPKIAPQPGPKSSSLRRQDLEAAPRDPPGMPDHDGHRRRPPRGAPEELHPAQRFLVVSPVWVALGNLRRMGLTSASSSLPLTTQEECVTSRERGC
mmetsp:Transcript_27002/g.82868  ORF Transcript_27002/g.82868 Transcript_27002/m.82868 type:complete len:116 (+) Transcript_27002:674-1021(+)